MTVKKCMQQVSSAEFCYWQAYSISNPIGGLRSDIQASVIAQQVDMLVQLKTTKAGRQCRYKELADFMPLNRHKKTMSPEDMMACFCIALGKPIPDALMD
jgi:hypothetical protein